MESLQSLTFIINPWSLNLPAYVAVIIVKEMALQITDFCVTCACRFLKPLPSRTGTKVLYKNQLGGKDAAVLTINSVIESIFTCHILYMLWNSPLIVRSWTSIGFLNGPVALLLLILYNDMLYAPAHRLLHHPALYAYIHKHHHRSVYPTRGNIDARNEHPLEQLMAMSLWMIAIHLVSLTGLHAVALGGHLSLMTVGASLNHTGFDLQVSLLGVDLYSTAAHEMHHRRPDKNFAQFTMVWDKLMGTYIPYAKEEGAEEDAGNCHCCRQRRLVCSDYFFWLTGPR
ncbi:unnamed protein product [Effrenium voratum]|uniref:Fatty acid hydroxylase domain-containing protein n=1 Tax=Effrenium voratum TaxID=2562239 RepID=A0AA36J330_9DINO|nr:unnamed protein product [Effrenium voratum]CAJ1398232.1 unnamed protein product [Effrenium voratum]